MQRYNPNRTEEFEYGGFQYEKPQTFNDAQEATLRALSEREDLIIQIRNELMGEE